MPDLVNGEDLKVLKQIWKHCKAIKKEALEKVEDVCCPASPRDARMRAGVPSRGCTERCVSVCRAVQVDYIKGEGEYLMLEKLTDGTSRVPKVKLTDDWLEYLNFKEFEIDPKKRTFFNTLCTPYMYNQYACIFGLTGSVGGPAERQYIKETYRAVAFEVPQFLHTCRDTVKHEAKNLGVHLMPDKPAQTNKVCDLVLAHYRKVPVLVIARDKKELNWLHDALKKRLLTVSDAVMQDPDHLQKFRERDDLGVLLKDKWDKVVDQATQRHGTPQTGTYCCVTVTDYFGGRGHDFNVMDETANELENGGMLVVATTIPDTREWIQWKGRTARQDNPGQFAVVLSKKDAPFKDDHGYREAFEKLSHDQKIYADTQKGASIDGLLRKQDVGIKETLDRCVSQTIQPAGSSHVVTLSPRGGCLAVDAAGSPRIRQRAHGSMSSVRSSTRSTTGRQPCAGRRPQSRKRIACCATRSPGCTRTATRSVILRATSLASH